MLNSVESCRFFQMLTFSGQSALMNREVIEAAVGKSSVHKAVRMTPIAPMSLPTGSKSFIVNDFATSSKEVGSLVVALNSFCTPGISDCPIKSCVKRKGMRVIANVRSEEHTSELQS